MIDKVLNALETKDYRALAQCFSDNGKLFDYGPSCNGLDNYFCYGKDHIEMFYRNRFVHDHVRIGQARKESETRGSYFASYDGPYVYVRFEIEGVDSDGKILKAIIHGNLYFFQQHQA